MVKLCLMASQCSLPGFVFNPDQGLRRLSSDYQPLFRGPESTEELVRQDFLAVNLQGPHQIERPLNYVRGLLDSTKLVTIDPAIRRRLIIDVQGNKRDSILFSYRIAKECKNQGEILAFLSSSEVEEGGLNLSVLNDLKGLKTIPTEMPNQCLYAPDYGCFQSSESQPTGFCPSSNFYFEKPLSNLDDDLDHESEGMVYVDDQAALYSARTEMKDRLYIIAEYYLSKHSTKWRKQSVLVPQFDRLEFSEARDTINGSLKLEPLNVVPLKSPQKTRHRSSQKKKYSRKVGKEREQYRKNVEGFVAFNIVCQFHSLFLLQYWAFEYLDINRPKHIEGNVFPRERRWICPKKCSENDSPHFFGPQFLASRCQLNFIEESEVTWEPYLASAEYISGAMASTINLSKKRIPFWSIETWEYYLGERCLRQFGFPSRVPNDPPQMMRGIWKGQDDDIWNGISAENLVNQSLEYPSWSATASVGGILNVNPFLGGVNITEQVLS